jgi:hypothetical protein
MPKIQSQAEHVNASEKVIRFSRLRPEPGIQGEPRSTGTR